MAKQLLNLIDLAARRGTDKEVGLVQQVVNYAPELTTISGRTIPGTFSEAKVQIAIPKGGAFPGNNGTVAVSAGAYEKRRFNAFFFDSQLEIRQSELVGAAQLGDSMGDLQADEVSGALQDKAIKFSQQFYSGADANGYPGLIQMLKIFNGGDGGAGIIDSRTGQKIVNTIDAGGSGASATTECVWYVWNHPQGVHFLFGGDKTFDVNPWVWQYLGPSDARYLAQVSNISGFIGLMAANPWCVACIKNIDATHKWSDDLSAQLHALLPAAIKPTHCFATKRARAGLQRSRTVTLFGSAQAGKPGDIPNVAPVPTVDIEGIPIIPTDGIQLIKAF